MEDVFLLNQYAQPFTSYIFVFYSEFLSLKFQQARTQTNKDNVIFLADEPLVDNFCRLEKLAWDREVPFFVQVRERAMHVRCELFVNLSEGGPKFLQ